MQKWLVLVREDEQKKLKGLHEDIGAWVKNFEETRNRAENDVWCLLFSVFPCWIL